MDEGQVREWVAENAEFENDLAENEEWTKMESMKTMLEKHEGNLPPNVKFAMFKELSERGASSELRKEFWEKNEGKTLEDAAKEQARIGEQDDYVKNNMTDRVQQIEGRAIGDAAEQARLTDAGVI